MIRCLWMCIVQGFLTPMSGLMSASCSMENLYRQREKERKDWMSFSAISLIDYIDMFNPPLVSHFNPLPFFLVPICSLFSLSLTLLSCFYLSAAVIFLSAFFKPVFSIVPFIYSSCSVCFLRPSITKDKGEHRTHFCSAPFALIGKEQVSKCHYAELEIWSRLTWHRSDESGHNTKQNRLGCRHIKGCCMRRSCKFLFLLLNLEYWL